MSGMIIFYLISLVVIISALVAVFSRNIVNAAFALFFTLFGMAGYFVLLGADFLAITQIVIYVGGILVLLIFGVLLTHRTVEGLSAGMGRASWLVILVGAIVYLSLLGLIFTAHWKTGGGQVIEPTTRNLGKLLLTRYLLPFEIASVVLLIVLVGAAFLVRRRD